MNSTTEILDLIKKSINESDLVSVDNKEKFYKEVEMGLISKISPILGTKKINVVKESNKNKEKDGSKDESKSKKKTKINLPDVIEITKDIKKFEISDVKETSLQSFKNTYNTLDSVKKLSIVVLKEFITYHNILNKIPTKFKKDDYVNIVWDFINTDDNISYYFKDSSDNRIKNKDVSKNWGKNLKYRNIDLFSFYTSNFDRFKKFSNDIELNLYYHITEDYFVSVIKNEIDDNVYFVKFKNICPSSNSELKINKKFITSVDELSDKKYFIKIK